MKKLKILACPANEGGCAYYRVIQPAKKLQELYGDKVEVRINLNPLGIITEGEKRGQWQEDFDYEDMKWADIVWTNNISNWGGPYTLRLIGKAKEFGKFVHYDTDDLLTDLYKTHHLFDVYKDKGLGDMTKSCYANADLVTVTQKKFAQRIQSYCGGVLAIVKNAIDYDLPCWNAQKTQYDAMRVGWAGGIHHRPDVRQIAGVPGFVNKRVGARKVHWGFYGSPPAPTEDKPKEWQHEVWDEYKRVLTAGMKENNWRIYDALSPDSYGGIYSFIDLSIAPLEMNNFNDSKSDIKVAECGRYKVPLIASNVGCYDETIENGRTGYLIDPGAPRSEWVKVLSKCINNPKHVRDMGENLHAITERDFDSKKVVGHRLDLYDQALSIIKPRRPEMEIDWTND